MYYTDPAQYLITAGQDLGDLDRDVSDLSDAPTLIPGNLSTKTRVRFGRANEPPFSSACDAMFWGGTITAYQGVRGDFGWVRFPVVCFLYKANPNPRRKNICCG